MTATNRKRIINCLCFIPLILIIGFIVLPYLWTFVTSLKSNSELYSTHVTYIPKAPSLNNYRLLLQTTDFLPAMCRSLFVAIATTAIAVCVSSLAAYAFSRYQFRFKNLILSGILLLYMFPTVLYLTPLFLVFKKAGILGTWWCLLISNCTFTIPFSIWLLTSYIGEIPIELEEAAKIDGATVRQIFVKIIVPLLKPGIVATASYVFVSAWNEYLFSVMFTSSSTRTLTVSLASLIGEYDIRWDMISAGAILAIIPVMILFLFFQKNLVAGMTAGAVKG